MNNKVLIVMMHMKMGGAEKSLVNFLNELHSNDCDIDLMLFKNTGVLLKQLPDFVNVIESSDEVMALYGKVRYKPYLLYLNLIRILGTIFTKKYTKRRYFVRWQKYFSKYIPINTKKYDIAISYISGEPMYYVADKVQAKRKYTWVHTDYKASCGCADDDIRFFRKLDAIITISEECKVSLQKAVPQISDKVKVLPNIVSSELIRKQSLEFPVMEYSNNMTIILSIGRLEKVKGFDIAIDSAKILKDNGLLYQWFIIGDGTERDNLQRQIEKNRLMDQVFLLGLKDNPYPYIKNCHIVVQSSRFEGKSIALDEAKILLKPIVATNYSTIKDQLSNNEGVIVEMSANGIADGIQYLIKNQDIYKK